MFALIRKIMDIRAFRIELKYYVSNQTLQIVYLSLSSGGHKVEERRFIIPTEVN